MSRHLPSTYVAVPGERKITDYMSSSHYALDPRILILSEDMTEDGFQMITFEKSKLTYSVCIMMWSIENSVQYHMLSFSKPSAYQSSAENIEDEDDEYCIA
ncbi:hypothetical protein AMECASPLE_012687 [Ameca splendens]|uniref:Uncharacterized protein n=1 Tax=Ameca splendens TaxID=208324 RepID=A0ABV0YPM6_9TELE